VEFIRWLATTSEQTASALAYEEVSRAESCEGVEGIDPEEGSVGHASTEAHRAYALPAT